MQVVAGTYWGVGKRSNNQDTLALQQVMTADGRVLLAIVCDGIGGLAQGEMASGYIVEEMIVWFYQEALQLLRKNKKRELIKRSCLCKLHKIHEELTAYAIREGIQLGSTMTLLLLWEKQYLVLHLGDSRLYLCSRRKKQNIRQLTMDHSYGRNELSKCLGSFSWQRPDVIWGHLRKEQGFLLCSDGFRHVVSMQRLGEMFHPKQIQKEQQIEKHLEQVARYSMEKGEQDNQSAIYIKVVSV